MAKIWDILWAVSGDKITIPEPAQAGGEVSVTTGWTPDYELPDTDPDYKPVGRDEMNGALNEITSSIQQLQLQGAAEWSSSLAPYPKGAEVIHAGERWFSPVAGNSTEPGAVGATWSVAGTVPDATETVKGISRFATSVENAAGSAQLVGVDPLGIREAFNAAGAAPVFACRAWVNFNGVGAVAMRGNGNVSSITDNGVGDYTVNFATALPDANFSVGGGLFATSGYTSAMLVIARTASSVRVQSKDNGGNLADVSECHIQVFR